MNVNFNYRLECFLGEELKIKTSPLQRGSKSFVLAQEIIKPAGGIAIDGTATSLVMDMRTRETLAVPACLARYLSRRD